MNRRDFNKALLSAGAVFGLSSSFASRAFASNEKVAVTAVDTHAHVFHRGLPFVQDRRYTPEYDALPEDYYRMLDDNGMSHGVVIPISILGTNNDYTVEVLKKSNGRLRGLAVINPDKDAEKLNALNEAGIVGIRLNLMKKPVPDFTTEGWKQTLEECRRLNWQVEVHDHATRLPETIKPLVDQGMNVVVDHFGVPSVDLGVEDPGFKFLCGLGGTKQVWVKLSAPYRSSNEIAAAAAPLLLKAFGPERLMWGSDWPHTNFEGKVQYKTLRAQLDQWVPDEAERKIVLADTPAKLFRFV